MEKINFAGAALLSALAVCVVLVTSASALPEFKTAKFPVRFTSTNVLPLERLLTGSVLGITVRFVCKMVTGEGEFDSTTTMKKIFLTYTECKIQGSSTACTTSGQATGVIKTKELQDVIGYIKKSTPTVVGAKLTPVSGEFTKFTCSGLPEAVTSGCVIGEAKPLNVSQTTGELLFEDGESTTQRFTKLEGESTACELSTFGAKFAVMDLDKESFAAAIELKA